MIRRRALFELEKSEDRSHVLEGLLTALDHIDRVIELIRASTSPKAAADRLCAELGLTQRQADAILAMRLASLTRLEGEKLAEEQETLRKRIAELKHLVEEDASRRDLLRVELQDLLERYGDNRRTVILDESKPFPLPSGEGGESSLVLLSRLGYVKAQAVRAGGGMSGAEAMVEREGDFVRQAFVARGSTHLLLFTARGNVCSVAVRDLPAGTRSSRGKPLAQVADVAAGDRIVAAIPVADSQADRYVLFATRTGQVKRTSLSEYSKVRGGGIKATGLADDDEVLAVILTSGAGDILLASRSGLAIRFSEDEIRPMGRTARGVRGIDLQQGDELIGASVPRRDSHLLAITSNGSGKRMPFTELRRQGRAGKGVTVLPERDSAGDLVGLLEVHPADRAVCELGSGELVALRAEDLPEKPRRGASARIKELTGSDGPVVAVHPLRASPLEAVAGEAEAEVTTGGEAPGAEVAPGGEAPGGAKDTAVAADGQVEDMPPAEASVRAAVLADAQGQGELDLIGG